MAPRLELFPFRYRDKRTGSGSYFRFGVVSSSWHLTWSTQTTFSSTTEFLVPGAEAL